MLYSQLTIHQKISLKGYIAGDKTIMPRRFDAEQEAYLFCLRYYWQWFGFKKAIEFWLNN